MFFPSLKPIIFSSFVGIPKCIYLKFEGRRCSEKKFIVDDFPAVSLPSKHKAIRLLFFMTSSWSLSNSTCNLYFFFYKLLDPKSYIVQIYILLRSCILLEKRV